jgi:hypothetical protein
MPGGLPELEGCEGRPYTRERAKSLNKILGVEVERNTCSLLMTDGDIHITGTCDFKGGNSSMRCGSGELLVQLRGAGTACA